MSFDPTPEYRTIPENIKIEKFSKLAERYVTRPPYQRKAVWTTKKKQALLDSLFRRYYIPKLVIREVRLNEKTTRYEIIDGQQRITTVQDFFNDKFSLPHSLKDIDQELVGKKFSELDIEHKEFVCESLQFQADIITGIDKALDPNQQLIATEIFRRLQKVKALIIWK